ncbi:unnamed protein product [Bemisia tabaci]|uniref:Uncharacterized protein n=1 Tax=Bemisia tabaci TaxID=7038 RepID=A0A9P0F8I5_BEMTA|nr:unnamed protein product [Bemisia tabaci]
MISRTVTLVVLFTAISGSFKTVVTERNDTKQNQQHLIHLKDQGEDENPNSSFFKSQWVKNYGEREDFNVRNSQDAGYFDINRATDQPSHEFPELAVKPSVIVQPRILEEIYQICSENVATGDSQNDDVIIKCKSEIAPTKFADHMQDPEKIASFEGFDLECLVNLLSEKYGSSRSLKDGSQWLIDFTRRNSESNVKSINSPPGHAPRYLFGEVHQIACFIKAVSLFPSNLEHPTDGSHYKSVKLATANHETGLPTEDADQNLKRRLLQKAYSTLSNKANYEAGQGLAASVLQNAREGSRWLWEKSAPIRDTVSTEGRKYFDRAASGSKYYFNAASRRFRGSKSAQIQDNLSLGGRSFAETAPGVVNHLLSANERKSPSRNRSFSNSASEEKLIQALKKDNLFDCLLKAVRFIPGQALGLVTENITGTATKSWGYVRGVGNLIWRRGEKSPRRSPTSSPSRKPNGISSPSRSRSPTRNSSNTPPSLTDVVTGPVMQKTYDMVKQCFEFFEHDEEGKLILNQQYAAGTAETVLMKFPTTALMLGTAKAVTQNVRMTRDADGKFSDYNVDTRGLVTDLGMAVANASPIGKRLMGLSNTLSRLGTYGTLLNDVANRIASSEGNQPK